MPVSQPEITYHDKNVRFAKITPAHMPAEMFQAQMGSFPDAQSVFDAIPKTQQKETVRVVLDVKDFQKASVQDNIKFAGFVAAVDSKLRSVNPNADKNITLINAGPDTKRALMSTGISSMINVAPSLERAIDSIGKEGRAAG